MLTIPDEALLRRCSEASLEPQNEIAPGCETLIEIDKKGRGLGISVIGGCDTVLSAITVHEIYPDGAASMDGRLCPGDQLVEVSEQSLKSMTHEEAIDALRRTPPTVTLLVFRDPKTFYRDPACLYNTLSVTLMKKPAKGLGFSIVGKGGNQPGVFISEIVPHCVADLDGSLLPGDQIMEINGQNVMQSSQEEVATLLKMSMGQVMLKIGRLKLVKPRRRPSNQIVANGDPAAAASRQSYSSSGKSRNSYADSCLDAGDSDSTASPPLRSFCLTQQRKIPDSALPFCAPWDCTRNATTNGSADHCSSPFLRPKVPSQRVPSPVPKDPVVDLSRHNNATVGGHGQSYVERTLKPQFTLSGVPVVRHIDPPPSNDTPTLLNGSSSNSQHHLLTTHNHIMTTPDTASENPGITAAGTTGSWQHHGTGSGCGIVRARPKRPGILSINEDTSNIDILVEVPKPVGQDLGMGIAMRAGQVIITTIQAGSAASKKLRVGDKLVAINGVPVLEQESAVQVIKSASTDPMFLQVARSISQFSHDESRNPASISIQKCPNGALGFSVVGGHQGGSAAQGVTKLPLLVKRVFADGTAAHSGQLHAGDEIVAVNGESVVGLSHQAAVSVLKNAQSPVILRILPLG
jgi:C-terminal processing protease CtpA/Prc